MGQSQSNPEQSDGPADLLRAEAYQSKTEYKCWFCSAWVPKGDEVIVEVPGKDRGFYVRGAEPLAISCGCRS